MPKFVNHIDLDYNQLIRGTFEKVTVDPGTPVAGQLVYNTTNNVVRLRRASTWEVMWVGQMLDNAGGINIGNPDIATGTVTIGLKTDDVTINLNASDQLQIKAVQPELIPLNQGSILIGDINNKAASQVVFGDVLISPIGETVIGANKVTYPKLQQSSATGYAIIAKTTIGAGNYTELNATANDRVLGRVANALGFVRITNNMVADGTFSGSKLFLTDGQIFVGNASNRAAGVTMSGDATISNTGVLTISAEAVTYSKMQNMTAYAVLGRSGATAGSMAPITAITDTLLGRVGSGSLGFAKLADSQINADTITYPKLKNTTTSNRVLGKMGAVGAVGEVQVYISTDTITYNDSTLMSSLAIKNLVDEHTGGMGTLIGGWDAATEIVFPGTAGTIKGDYWHVTSDGTIQGIQFRVGDVIIAKQDNPTNTNPDHYIFLEKNIDIATEATYGTIKLATQTEVNNAASGALAVTPATLDGWRVNLKIPRTVQGTLATNGTLTTVTFTHNLGTKTGITATVVEIATDKIVYPDIEFNSTTQCRVSFATPPLEGTYRIFVVAYG